MKKIYTTRNIRELLLLELLFLCLYDKFTHKPSSTAYKYIYIGHIYIDR